MAQAKGSIMVEMKYFKMSEFACPCCGKADMDPRFLETLDKLRELYGYPISISSGYRCAAHNAKVEGKTDSQHLHGKAADIRTGEIGGERRYRLLKLAMELFEGIGVGKNLIHVDNRAIPVSAWGY